jgi:hypothetical protein
MSYSRLPSAWSQSSLFVSTAQAVIFVWLRQGAAPVIAIAAAQINAAAERVNFFILYFPLS